MFRQLRSGFLAFALVVTVAIPASAQWQQPGGSGTLIYPSSPATGVAPAAVGMNSILSGINFEVAGAGEFGGAGSSFTAPRLTLGAAGADFGTIGYGYVPSASTNFTYNYQSLCSCDAASQLYFNSGKIDFRVAAGGASLNGTAITWTTPVSVGGVGQTALTVNGSVSVSTDLTVAGNIAAKYQDVAEWVPANKQLTPGTVVVLDPDHTNRVMASALAYDTRVAGVVSSQPGVLLGVAAADKEKVATTGRVKVRVDASKHPIHIGDLLVSSGSEGTAMVSEPVNVNGISMHRPGTIIGKALEPLASGNGEILVLLSLQ